MARIRGHDGEYEEKNIIGQGAYGRVYLCHHVGTGRALAVKELNIQTLGFPSIIECAILSTFHHPFLQDMVDRQVGENVVHVIQPLGVTDLNVYIRSRPPLIDTDPELIFRWTHQLSQALACLHQYNIIHGDIKPSNVLLMDDGNVRLADFTLSVQTLWDGQEFRHTAYTITHRAPEVIRSAWRETSWGRPADIWALGCSLFEIGYRISPFRCQMTGETEETDLLFELTLAHIGNTLGDVDLQTRWPLPCEPATPWPDDITGNRVLNTLVHSMIRVDPTQRPTAMALVARRNDVPADFSVTFPVVARTPRDGLDDVPGVPAYVLQHAAYLETLVTVKLPCAWPALICMALKINGMPFHPHITQFFKTPQAAVTEVLLLKHLCFRVLSPHRK